MEESSREICGGASRKGVPYSTGAVGVAAVPSRMKGSRYGGGRGGSEGESRHERRPRD